MEAGGKALSKTFTRRLIWRDLAYWQLHHWPAMAAVPMRPHYAAQVCALQRAVQTVGKYNASRLSGVTCDVTCDLSTALKPQKQAS